MLGDTPLLTLRIFDDFSKQVPSHFSHFLQKIKIFRLIQFCTREKEMLFNTHQVHNGDAQILVGREIQRAYGLEPQSLLTVPLLEGTDGTKKMSKSAENYIGLTEEPREMFGKIMSISDELMYKYYLLLTNEDIDEIKNIHPMEAKKRLASFLVKKYHGETGAQVASRYFEETFVKKEIPETVAEVSMPAGKYPVVDFVLKAGLDVSKTELKRLMSQRAVEIDGRLIDNFREEIEFGREIILRVGKKTLLKVVPRS